MRIVSIPSFPCPASTGHAAMLMAGLLLLAALGPLAAAERAETGRSDGALLAARLEAGEYGPAVDNASGIDDVAERVEHLKQIAAAQRHAGEFQAAEATAARIPIREQRARTRGEAVRQRGAGGGVQADFNSLMNLISSTVQPDTGKS
jgi:hypothetical protein